MRQTIEEENEEILDLAKKNESELQHWRENMSTCDQIIDANNYYTFTFLTPER